jgi:hypothetical protein
MHHKGKFTNIHFKGCRGANKKSASLTFDAKKNYGDIFLFNQSTPPCIARFVAQYEPVLISINARESSLSI